LRALSDLLPRYARGVVLSSPPLTRRSCVARASAADRARALSRQRARGDEQRMFSSVADCPCNMRVVHRSFTGSSQRVRIMSALEALGGERRKGRWDL